MLAKMNIVVEQRQFVKQQTKVWNLPMHLFMAEMAVKRKSK